MTQSAFVAMSDLVMASLIDDAKVRIYVAAPGVHEKATSALQKAVARLGSINVAVVLDCDEEVFRLGYGDIDALNILREAGCRVRHAAGLRVGVLVCDDRAWIYAPTALYVQAETISDHFPNAVALQASDVERIQPHGDTNHQFEIGREEVSETLVEQARKALDEAPPIAFDVARQVRVFSPYVQYVEVKLLGCAIHRHRIVVPKSLQGMALNPQIEARLHTTFDLIEKSDGLSSNSLEDQLNTIRDNFTRTLGRPWGRVILRAQRSLFDARIDEFRHALESHKKHLEERLAASLAHSRELLIEYFLPLVERKPPDALLGQITMSKPNTNQIRAWLNKELEDSLPTPAALIKGMNLDVQFRDVTYETLVGVGFAEKLREVYPQVEWDKPFAEFDAARQRDSKQMRLWC
jgi:hypothetical protein